VMDVYQRVDSGRQTLSETSFAPAMQAN